MSTDTIPTTPAWEAADTDRLEPFTVDTPERAAWAADKVLAARERLARVTASCAAMIQQAGREADDAAAFFLPMLEEWARANPPRKGKTIRLPTGALSFRSVPGGPRLADPDAALAWARQNKPELIEVRERVTITALKEFIVASGGELPDGVEMTDSRETFDVKGA
jgi:hypothetical protein